MRLPLLLPLLLAACAQPAFLASDKAGTPPPLLPIEQILTTGSPQLDAEAAAALSARGDGLRDRAGST